MVATHSTMVDGALDAAALIVGDLRQVVAVIHGEMDAVEHSPSAYGTRWRGQTGDRALVLVDLHSMMQANEKVAVLCDFDGTATFVDVTATLYLKFGDAVCEAAMKRWARGEITTAQELRTCFLGMYRQKEEMEAFLGTVPLDPGFGTLVSLCRRRGYDFALLSDGLHWIIDRILERHGFDSLTVYANEIEFLQDGVELSFPWHDPNWPMLGVSKPSIVNRYQEEGFRVVFIGDGLSDVQVAGVADLLYAKGRFLESCREAGIPAIPFSELGEVVENWQEPPFS